LEEAILALEKDNAFLLKGKVFTEDLIAAWVTWKREKELDEMHLRPHPYEFHMYYDN
jgi:glutamine synthetase